jgi:hypothetical protein
MAEEAAPEVYQLHVWIHQISPMIWRRLRVRDESTLAELHDVIQVAFGWSDFHLHRFRIGVPIVVRRAKARISSGCDSRPDNW